MMSKKEINDIGEMIIDGNLKEITAIIKNRKGKKEAFDFWIHYIQPIEHYLKTGKIVQNPNYVDSTSIELIKKLNKENDISGN